MKVESMIKYVTLFDFNYQVQSVKQNQGVRLFANLSYIKFRVQSDF